MSNSDFEDNDREHLINGNRFNVSILLKNVSFYLWNLHFLHLASFVLGAIHSKFIT